MSNGLPGIVISFMLYPLTPPTRPIGRQARRGVRSTFQSIRGFEKGFLKFSYNMEGNKMGSIQYFIRRNAVSRPVLDEILTSGQGAPWYFFTILSNLLISKIFRSSANVLGRITETPKCSFNMLNSLWKSFVSFEAGRGA